MVTDSFKAKQTDGVRATQSKSGKYGIYFFNGKDFNLNKTSQTYIVECKFQAVSVV
jgi:DNA gyrase inhibitor GyrI